MPELIDLHVYDENKVFVTGVAASGKTEFSKQYSKRFACPYIDFDKKFNYTMIHYENLDEVFLKGLPENFVIDAIPFRFYNNIYDINAFLRYCKTNDVRIVCLCCTDKDEYKKRLLSKNYRSFVYGFVEYHWFYMIGIKRFHQFKLDFFDTYANEYITHDELMRRIEWIKPLSNFM